MATWRTLDRAAEETGISRRTLTRWISQGRLRAYTVAGDLHRFVDLDEIAKLREPKPIEPKKQSRLEGGVMSMKPHVSLDSLATEIEVTAVRQAFEAVGLEADVSASYIRKSAGDLPWALLIEGLFLSALATAAGKEIGQAAGKAAVAGVAIGARRLQELVRRLYEARSPSASLPGVVVLIDGESGTEIVLPEGLPEEAARQLIETPIVETPSGQLVWDFDSNSWRG